MADSPGVRFSSDEQWRTAVARAMPTDVSPRRSPHAWLPQGWEPLSPNPLAEGLAALVSGRAGRPWSPVGAAGDGQDDGATARVRLFRRLLLTGLFSVLLGVLVAAQVVRWAQPPPVGGIGIYDPRQMLGMCPSVNRCDVVHTVASGMSTSATQQFPAMTVTSASSLVDRVSGQRYVQRMTLRDGPIRVILWATDQPLAAKQRMAYQTVALLNRTVVSAWPVDGSTLRGASALMIGGGQEQLPVSAAQSWVRTTNLFS